jgi:hypothetical protein
MAGAASAGPVEVCRSGFRVAREHILNLQIGPTSESEIHSLMEEVRQVAHLLFGQARRGFTTLQWMSFREKGADFVTIAVV